MANTQIYEVLAGRPFGRGIHGSATLSADPHTRRRGSGTSGTATLTLSASAYADGDLILIHQSWNTATGTEENYEVNQIASGGGTTTLTLENNLARTYSNAQVLDIKEYVNLTISSFTVTGWTQANQWGGLLAISALGAVTWSGTITNKGGDGFGSTIDTGGKPSPAGGFRGGWNSTDASIAQQGDGWAGAPSESQSANGNGGGGGTNAGAGRNPGGSGGNATSGGSAGGNGGAGGSSAGNTALTSLFFGGGGGGGNSPDNTQNAGGGGSGGGAGIFWFNNLTITGSGNFNGGNGGSVAFDSDGASGAGGSVLLNVQNATIGTNLLTATGGGAVGLAPAGSNGRFRINYGSKVTGTTNPSASTNQDVKLNVNSGGSLLYALA